MNLGTGNRPFLLLFFNSRLRATICQTVRMSAFENTRGPVSTRSSLLRTAAMGYRSVQGRSADSRRAAQRTVRCNRMFGGRARSSRRAMARPYYRLPLARLWVAQSIWQFAAELPPLLLHAETWSASISANFHILLLLAAWPTAQ